MSHTDRFIELVLDPATWEEKACHLLEAAALFEAKLGQFWQGVRSGTGWHDEFVAIYFMLSAFAIENLLKARLVRAHRPELESQLRSSYVASEWWMNGMFSGVLEASGPSSVCRN